MICRKVLGLFIRPARRSLGEVGDDTPSLCLIKKISWRLMMNEQLKQEVKDYWNIASCGTEFIDKPKFSPEYFEAV